MSVIVCEKR